VFGDGLPGPEIWLVFRGVLSTGELKVYLNNVPLETLLLAFAAYWTLCNASPLAPGREWSRIKEVRSTKQKPRIEVVTVVFDSALNDTGDDLEILPWLRGRRETRAHRANGCGGRRRVAGQDARAFLGQTRRTTDNGRT
jgi:hypothetical protein